MKDAVAKGDVETLRRVSERLGFADWDPDLREKIETALRPEPTYLKEQLALWEEVPRHVDVRATPGKGWLILDFRGRQLPGCGAPRSARSC